MNIYTLAKQYKLKKTTNYQGPKNQNKIKKCNNHIPHLIRSWDRKNGIIENTNENTNKNWEFDKNVPSCLVLTKVWWLHEILTLGEIARRGYGN